MWYSSWGSIEKQWKTKVTEHGEAISFTGLLSETEMALWQLHDQSPIQHEWQVTKTEKFANTAHSTDSWTGWRVSL